MAMEFKPFSSFQIGDKASQSKTVTEADVVLFAGLTGDFNPIHLDAEYAKTTFFKTRLVQGMFVASLVGAVAAPFCGSASINMGQTFTFPAPARIGDTLTATIELIEKVEERHDLILKLTVMRQDGVVVLDGRNTVKIMDKKKA
ncbi:MAG: MaoC family dehydratase [Intestinimonas massiliensis]|uniref:MaoC family dehydratase n=1 Tax=Intestinimonas TaxID=1392389 RepID=UPI00243101A4|nr:MULTISPECIES: MaoC family dehydratase [Intestinimonas]MCI5563044.1 MaoC family dehydratase [Intestinimonas massiliensis (ex Afouda et al. 2020)]MDY5337969.1 MaoC family dehydratase [Intestinimonas sp.]